MNDYLKYFLPYQRQWILDTSSLKLTRQSFERFVEAKT
jgi:phage FluMu gp28-like protein